MAFCVKCGERLGESAAFCAGCGAPAGGGFDAPRAATPPARPPVAPGRAPQARAGGFSSPSRRLMVIALTAIVSIAAVIVIGFFVLGSSAVRGKAMMALAKHYEGTWVSQQSGDGVTIDTSGGVVSVRLFRSDGSAVGSFAANGDAVTIDNSNGSPAHMTIGSDKVVVTTSDGETTTFLRKPLGGE
jgi:hypothetical protein